MPDRFFDRVEFLDRGGAKQRRIDETRHGIGGDPIRIALDVSRDEHRHHANTRSSVPTGTLPMTIGRIDDGFISTNPHSPSLSRGQNR